jgi:hypothetical protein
MVGAFLFGRKMINNLSSRKHAARKERLQKKHEAGFMSVQFPEVANIVINMMYNQRGIAKALQRTVNFFPSSYAFFRLDCLSKECVEGGFDLTQVITSMIENRKKAAKGELSCEGRDPSAGHSEIAYEVAIQYT